MFIAIIGNKVISVHKHINMLLSDISVHNVIDTKIYYYTGRYMIELPHKAYADFGWESVDSGYEVSRELMWAWNYGTDNKCLFEDYPALKHHKFVNHNDWSMTYNKNYSMPEKLTITIDSYKIPGEEYET